MTSSVVAEGLLLAGGIEPANDVAVPLAAAMKEMICSAIPWLTRRQAGVWKAPACGRVPLCTFSPLCLGRQRSWASTAAPRQKSLPFSPDAERNKLTCNKKKMHFDGTAVTVFQREKHASAIAQRSRRPLGAYASNPSCLRPTWSCLYR
jgi:hypothetical protein